MNISFYLVLFFFLSLFCQCERSNLESDKYSIFNFPEIDNIESSVYNEIKITCETYWNLSDMIDTTFEIITYRDEYAVHCDGYLDGELYQFVIRVDKNGKWINDGYSIKVPNP